MTMSRGSSDGGTGAAIVVPVLLYRIGALERDFAAASAEVDALRACVEALERELEFAAYRYERLENE